MGLVSGELDLTGGEYKLPLSNIAVIEGEEGHYRLKPWTTGYRFPTVKEGIIFHIGAAAEEVLNRFGLSMQDYHNLFQTVTA